MSSDEQSLREPVEPGELLHKAKALIIERGWTRGLYEGPGGCLCAKGALYVAAGGNPVGYFGRSASIKTALIEAADLLRVAVRGNSDYRPRNIHNRNPTVTEINDAFSSDGPVLRWFDQAIRIADGSQDSRNDGSSPKTSHPQGEP
jgi:hypothetical protein